MKRLILTILLLIMATAFAQQAATVGGVVKAEAPLPDTVRVGIHVIDLDGRTLLEVASSPLVVGTFSVTTVPLAAEQLQPFRGGAIPLPGLGTEYRVSPEGVNFARAVTKVYEDNDGSESWSGPESDVGYLGVASLEGGGFFVLLFVDRDTTLSGRGTDLLLRAGWNIFTVQVNEQGELSFSALSSINNAILDMFRP